MELVAAILLVLNLDSRDFAEDVAGLIPCGWQCGIAYEQAAKDYDSLEAAAKLSASFSERTKDLRHEAANIASWWGAAYYLRRGQGISWFSNREEAMEVLSRRRWPLPLSWR